MNKPITISLLCFTSIITMSCTADNKIEKTPTIRHFDLKTIEALGQSIYERDSYAAKATDILFSEVGEPEKLTKEGIEGWIVTKDKQKVIVKFVAQIEEALLPIYDVTFTSSHEGKLTRIQGKKLLPEELAQFKAKQLALKNIPKFCSPRYNTVVLRDIDGEGFLVYALAATTDPNLVYIGGHYRITISKDGTEIEQIDRLFKSCLVLDRNDVLKDGKPAFMVGSHVVSNTPVETHVFVSLLHNLPLFIVTMDGEKWKIDKGEILAIGNVADK